MKERITQMRHFTLNDARRAARWDNDYFNRSAQKILEEYGRKFNKYEEYDIFLSHAFADAELILGAKNILEKEGFKVYIDWIDDFDLDRANITEEGAERIRERMKSCKHLVYVTSKNARYSKWMPWELGFFDGQKPDKVAIFPLLDNESDYFKGREYLSLYPILGKGLPLDMISAPRRGIEIFDGVSTKYFRAAA